ncbi:hypothetical protein, partial [Thiolapillus sp.]
MKWLSCLLAAYANLHTTDVSTFKTMYMNFLRLVLFLILLLPGGQIHGAELPAAQSKVTVEQIKAAVEGIEGRDDLSEENRKNILSSYKDAGEWLVRSKDYATRSKEYLRARTEAPRQSEAMLRKLKKLTDVKVDTRGLGKKTLEELEQLLETEKAAYAAKE